MNHILSQQELHQKFFFLSCVSYWFILSRLPRLDISWHVFCHILRCENFFCHSLIDLVCKAVFVFNVAWHLDKLVANLDSANIIPTCQRCLNVSVFWQKDKAKWSLPNGHFFLENCARGLIWLQVLEKKNHLISPTLNPNKEDSLVSNIFLPRDKWSCFPCVLQKKREWRLDEIALTTGVSRYVDPPCSSCPQTPALNSKYNSVTYRTFPIADSNIWISQTWMHLHWCKLQKESLSKKLFQKTCVQFEGRSDTNGIFGHQTRSEETWKQRIVEMVPCGLACIVFWPFFFPTEMLSKCVLQLGEGLSHTHHFCPFVQSECFSGAGERSLKQRN